MICKYCNKKDAKHGNICFACLMIHKKKSIHWWLEYAPVCPDCCMIHTSGLRCNSCSIEETGWNYRQLHLEEARLRSKEQYRKDPKKAFAYAREWRKRTQKENPDYFRRYGSGKGLIKPTQRTNYMVCCLCNYPMASSSRGGHINPEKTIKCSWCRNWFPAGSFVIESMMKHERLWLLSEGIPKMLPSPVEESSDSLSGSQEETPIGFPPLSEPTPQREEMKLSKMLIKDGVLSTVDQYGVTRNIMIRTVIK